MNEKAKYGVIAIVVIAALFGLYAAFAKTETIVDPTTVNHGGSGSLISSGLGSVLCNIYPPACKK